MKVVTKREREVVKEICPYTRFCGAMLSKTEGNGIHDNRERNDCFFVRARFWQLPSRRGLGWHPAKKQATKLLIANEKCLTTSGTSEPPRTEGPSYTCYSVSFALAWVMFAMKTPLTIDKRPIDPIPTYW